MADEHSATAIQALCLYLFALAAVPARGEANIMSVARQAIVASYPYEPALKTPAPAQTMSDLGFTLKSDSEIIVLPKFEVKSPPLPKGLPEAVELSRSFEPQNRSRYGTGIHQKDLGRIRLSAVTVFYVPIFVGLSW